MLTCPCCSKKLFSECCEPYLSGKSFAPTPEHLMRSRYTAYTLGKIDYIKATMAGQALKQFDKQAAQEWADNSAWLKLEILDAPAVDANSKKGIVEFIAYFSVTGQTQQLHERSQFIKNSGKWYYVNKVSATTKIGRNDPCVCGSGQKYKKCCG